MADDVNQRLREARVAAGYIAASKAAQAIGVGASTYMNHENGTGGRGVPAPALRRYAQFFRVSADWLLTGRGDMRGKGDTTSSNPLLEIKLAPLCGSVAAGAWLDHDDATDVIPAPVPYVPTRFPTLSQFAYKIVGNSVDLARLHDGDFAVCVPYWEARRAPVEDDLVIVERRRGSEIERTCKVLKLTKEGFELWPRSSNPKWQAPIVVRQDHLADDGTEIEIVALVIGRFSPL
jgi:transcriptional regulator with XRE-family HTH domain